MHPLSPPSRGSLLAIHALGLEKKVNLVVVDIPKREHLKPDFLEVSRLKNLNFVPKYHTPYLQIVLSFLW